MITWEEIYHSRENARKRRLYIEQLDKDAELIGISKKTWEAFKKKAEAHLIQDDLPNFLKAEAEARESTISRIMTQDHLAKWGLRFEKCGKFSDDPNYKRKMFLYTKKCFDLMNGHDR